MLMQKRPTRVVSRLQLHDLQHVRVEGPHHRQVAEPRELGPSAGRDLLAAGRKPADSLNTAETLGQRIVRAVWP
jgi:hypothetical protein